MKTTMRQHLQQRRFELSWLLQQCSILKHIVTIEEGAAGYLYSQRPPNLETRLTGQGDHMQGSRDLHSTGSHD